jgi:hypothetical protein
MSSSSRVSAAAAHASGLPITHEVKMPFNPFYPHPIDSKAEEATDGQLLILKSPGILVLILSMASDIQLGTYKGKGLSAKQKDVYEVMVEAWKKQNAQTFLGRCLADREFKMTAIGFFLRLFCFDDAEDYWSNKNMMKGVKGEALRVLLGLRKFHEGCVRDFKTMRMKRWQVVFGKDRFTLNCIMAKAAAPDCGDPE